MDILAEISQDAARQQAIARGAALALVVLGLAVAVFTSLILYAALRRYKAKRLPQASQPTKHVDVWKASADRIEYEKRSDEYEDDDDDEADESTWYEEDSDDDDDSFGSSASGQSDGPRPSNGPQSPHDNDDDSFAGDDIPGSRLDF